MSALVQLREKLEANSMPEPNTGCWLWLRSLNSAGYGKVCGFGDGTSRPAHRVSYEVFVGPIPEGLELDHLCRTPACINPSHLEPVTHQVNMLRGAAPSAVAHRTGLCAAGHPLRATGRGKQYCLICKRLKRGIYDLNPEPLKGGNKPQGLCGAGHPMSGDNLYVSPDGQRHCRACRAATARRFRANRRTS